MKKTRLKNLKINESSLVDKGANQMAFITLFKRDPDVKEARKDLENKSIFGKVKDFILHGLHKNDQAMTVDQNLEVTEARDDWWKLTCAFERSIMSILQDETADQGTMLTESVMQFINRAKQLAPYLQDMYKAEGAFAALEAISEDVSKAGKKISTANMERLKSAMKVLHELMGMDMEEYEAMYGEKKPKPDEPMKKSGIDDKNITKGDDQLMSYQEIFKSLTPEQQKAIQDEIAKQALEAVNKAKPNEDVVQKQLEDMNKANVELAKALEVERDLRITKEFTEIAKGYQDLPGVEIEAFGKTLRVLSDKAPDQYAELIKTLDASKEMISKNNILMKEIGVGAVPENDALVKMNTKAAEIQKANTGMTFEVAFAKVCNEDPALYNEYLQQSK